MTQTLRIALFAATLSALLACGDDSAPVCTAGMSVACVGPGGCAGGQACNAEGTGFGDCVCGGDDAGTSDTGAADTSLADTGSADTGASDTGMADTAPDDTGPEDAGFDVGPPAEFNCNPLTGVPCDGATPRCTATFAGDVVSFGCAAEGSVAQGDSCTAATDVADDCQSGTICQEVCTVICDASNPEAPDCPGGEGGSNCGGLATATEEIPVGLCY